MSKDKLVITYNTAENKINEIDDSVCDFQFQLELDPSDMSTHQLFNAFAKVLAAIGYHEFSIMKGACGLAFNDMRDPVMMDKLIDEYELAEPTENSKHQDKK